MSSFLKPLDPPWYLYSYYHFLYSVSASWKNVASVTSHWSLIEICSESEYGIKVSQATNNPVRLPLAMKLLFLFFWPVPFLIISWLEECHVDVSFKSFFCLNLALKFHRRQMVQFDCHSPLQLFSLIVGSQNFTPKSLSATASYTLLPQCNIFESYSGLR